MTDLHKNEKDMDEIILINPQQLFVPRHLQVLGVYGDEQSRGLTFKLTRYPTKYIDLGKAEIFVVYETFDGKAKSKDFIKDVTVTDDDVTFEWLPRNALFLNTGRLRVKLTAVVKDDMEVKQSWNTEPVILKISETLPDYEINDDQNGESVYYISVNDLITQEEGDALIDRVYEEAVEGIS